MTPPGPPTPRRWLRFSLRGAMLLMLLAALLLAWKVNQVSAKRRAVAEIERVGGQVVFFEPWGPVWLHQLIGEDYFADVQEVELLEKDGTDVRRIRVGPVTDEHLASIGRFPRVSVVKVGGSQITDEGIRQLVSAKSITDLTVTGMNTRTGDEPSKITDEGVLHLTTLPRLEKLTFGFGEAGLKNFARLSTLVDLWVSVPTLGDGGIDPIFELENLKDLRVSSNDPAFPDLKRIEQISRQRLPKLEHFGIDIHRHSIGWAPAEGPIHIPSSQ
jgi:hypothetical protein